MLGEILEDRYCVEAELGAGAMGHVYRARHVRCGREVAIKIMRREYADTPALVERFEREAQNAARVRHGNLAGVLDVGVAPDGAPFIVLELAPGVPLADLIRGPMPRERVVALMTQLLRALSHAHAAGLVHRDLKPDNVLVEQLADGGEHARIVDFGIALVADGSLKRLTEAGTVIGTPQYMSPEQAMGRAVDHRTDLFALGVIMYELLSGMPPFLGTNVEVVHATIAQDPPAIRLRAGVHVDPRLERIARKLMARRIGERFQSADEALAAFTPATDPIMIIIPPAPVRVCEPVLEPVAEPAPRRHRRWPLAVALAAAAATVAVACMTREAHASEVSAPLDLAAPAEHAVHYAIASNEAAPAQPASRAPARSPSPPPPPAPTAPIPPAPTCAAPPPSTTQLLVDRYKSVAHALADRSPTDELWLRFRRVHLLTALETDASRQAALAELAQIGDALHILNIR